MTTIPAQASAAGSTQRPDIAVLKGRLVDLEARLKESTTHRDALKEYVASSPPASELAPSPRHQMNLVDQQIRELDVQILNLQSDIRLTKAQLEEAAPVAAPIPKPIATPIVPPVAARVPTPLPTPITLMPPAPLPPPRGLTGPDIAWMGLMFLVLAPLAIAIAWRIARGGRDIVKRAEWRGSEERILRIEEALGGIAKDVDRMSEGQRFLTSVLAEGSSPFTAQLRERERVARDESVVMP